MDIISFRFGGRGHSLFLQACIFPPPNQYGKPLSAFGSTKMDRCMGNQSLIEVSAAQTPTIIHSGLAGATAHLHSTFGRVCVKACCKGASSSVEVLTGGGLGTHHARYHGLQSKYGAMCSPPCDKKRLFCPSDIPYGAIGPSNVSATCVEICGKNEKVLLLLSFLV